MAEGGRDFGYEDPYLDHEIAHDDDDEKTSLIQKGKDNQTFSFYPSRSSTPYGPEIEMKPIHEKSGRPETSYAETSFGGTKDIEERLAKLRYNAETNLLNTEGIPTVENPMTAEEKGREINKVYHFIKKRYPNAEIRKLPLGFSHKKPMDIVVLGPKGGETKVIKDNGGDFQKSFLNLGFVKDALHESFQEIQEKTKKQLIREKKTWPIS